MQYVGQTCRALQKRFGEHYRTMKKPKPIDTFLYQHFKLTGHSPNGVLVQPVEKLTYDKNSSLRFTIIKRHETELKWIKLLQTPFPLGFNDNIYHEGKISKIPDFDVFSLLEIRKRKSRSHGIRKKGNGKRKKHAVKRSNTSLKDLSKVLEDHGRNSVLSILSSLTISVLRILDTDANKFYDRNHQLYDAALLTRCYTQHALRPFIDSETNHKRHFLVYERSGKNLFWSIKNSGEVLNKLKSRGFRATSLSTYDFSTLYTTLPHNLIKEKLINLIEWTFKREGPLYIACNRLSSLLKTQNDINFGLAKTSVKP